MSTSDRFSFAVPDYITPGLSFAVTTIRDTLAARAADDAHGQNAEAAAQILSELAGKLIRLEVGLPVPEVVVTCEVPPPDPSLRAVFVLAIELIHAAAVRQLLRFLRRDR
jgi:hypothetical protein